MGLLGLHLGRLTADTGIVNNSSGASGRAELVERGSASRETLKIDLMEGTVAAGPWTTTFSPEPADSDEILARYLALVYEMRGIEAGTPIPLRTLDVSVLAGALTMSPRDVEGRLVILMEPGNRRIDALRSLLRRRVLLPVAGVVVAATAVGLLVVVPRSEATPGSDLGRAVGGAVADATQQVAPAPVEPEIGESLVVERGPDGTDTSEPGVELAPEPVEPEIGQTLVVER